MALREDYAAPCIREIEDMKKLLIELREDVETKLCTNYMGDTAHKDRYVSELNKILKKLNGSIDLCDEYKGRLR